MDYIDLEWADDSFQIELQNHILLKYNIAYLNELNSIIRGSETPPEN